MPASPQPAPFVVGMARSGTTLLRLMLDSHPDLAVPPESHFIPPVTQAVKSAADPAKAFMDRLLTAVRWPDLGLDSEALRARVAVLQPFDLSEAFRTVYRMYAEKMGKPLWGDKTPGYVLHLRLLHQVLPEARFIHLIRDGRDVALSIRALNQPIGGPALAEAARSIEAAASLWSARILEGRRQAAGLPHYLEVKYEDLVLHTEATLRRICAFAGLAWSAEMLAYHQNANARLRELNRDTIHADRVARTGAERLALHALTTRPPEPSRVYHWKADLPAGERQRFEQVAGPLLRDLGYETEAG